MLRDSIGYADTHEDEGVEYALAFGRGIDAATGKRSIRMYANEDTRNMDAEGLRALPALYARAVERELIPSVPPLDIVGLE